MGIRELFKHWTYQVFAPGTLLRKRYNAFRELLRLDESCLELIADIEEVHHGAEPVDPAHVQWLIARLSRQLRLLVGQLMTMSPTRYLSLPEYSNKIDFYIQLGLDMDQPSLGPPYVIPLDDCAEQPELAGGKAANLALARARTDLPIPDGFVVTANCFNYFVESGELREQLDRRLRHATPRRPEELDRLCAEMRELVLAADVPWEIAKDIQTAAARLGAGGLRLAVRSSAVSEDGNAMRGGRSFAGPYASGLDVAAEDILTAYKHVLAGKYTPRAVTYRILSGLADTQTPMAVLVLPMVDARAAGVAYSLDPAQDAPAVGVHAVAGLGTGLVEGRAQPQTTRLSRDALPRVLENPDTGAPLLGAEQAKALARMALELENVFAAPQDVEWALDAAGLHILQCRPVAGGGEDDAPPLPELPPEPDCGRVLADGLTRCAAGAATGTLYRMRHEADLDRMPQGAVVAAPALTPGLARCLGRAGGVVAASGSRASHFASVAREFGLPVAAGPLDLDALPEGETATLWADAGVLCLGGTPADTTQAEGTRGPNPASARFAPVMDRITRLTLTDPEADNFSPEGCRSLHDVVRFVHEKGVAEMFSLVGKGGRGLARAKRLESRLPLSMYVLDLGDGLFEAARDKPAISPEDITSQPMWALWWGLADESVAWDPKQVHVDWEQMDRHSGGLFNPATSRLLASYAVISAEYMHLMVRFGYHFSVVDAFCGPEANANYVHFRFKGGGADFDRRLLRLQFLERVLAAQGFDTATRGDMLDAKLARAEETVVQKRLAALGHLLAVTRLMDMGMQDEAQAEAMAEDYLRDRGA